MSPAFKFNHVGIAVENLEQATEFYVQALGSRIVAGPFEDPIQKVKLCFLGSEPHRGVLEIISPSQDDSPLKGYLSKGIGAYHVCYEVADLEKSLTELRSKGCIIVATPVPAVAFGGRMIAWCFTPTKHLIELLQAADDS
jgi:methylmalonyl-CoA/ethylmalonyl-CoA epimerase